MSENARMRPSAVVRVGFVFIAVPAFVVLCGLGIWQLERHAEKREQAEFLSIQQQRATVALPEFPQWDELDVNEWEYRRVRLRGVFDPGKEVYWFNSRNSREEKLGVGYDIMTPFQLSTGGWVVVNRGFIATLAAPESSNAGIMAEEVALTGFLRKPVSRRWFDPDDDSDARVWVVRDLPAMAAWMGIHPVAPWFVHAETPAVISDIALPQPVAPPLGMSVRRVDHIAYALTWFTLAGLAALITIVYCRQYKTP